jgi:tetratricopeptide (TPR) repeat protein
MALDARLSRYFQEEQTARRCFIYFAAYINQNKVFDEKAIPEFIKKEMVTLKSMLLDNKNYDFNYYALNALFFVSYLRKDIDSMEKVSKKAITFFNSKTGFPQLGKFSFVQKLGFIYEQQRNYQKAIKTYETALSFDLIDGGTSWFNVRSHLFDAHLALRNYRNCYKYLSKAISNKGFKSLFSNYKEPWLIREAYINFLIEAGKVDMDIMKEHQLRSFSISRFVNDVVLFSKDKRGLNISVLIIQSLFLLLREDYDGFERKLDSLNQYAFRYLKNDETLRSNAFIKILQKLPDVNYHPVRWVNHTQKLLKRMKSAKLNSSFDTKEKEIMSYEIIHEVLIEILEKQKVYA